ncbi:MAG TPA: hypothetical protein VE093_49010 [Polyangiaceae bacterium]|nr:hypothetical protein [Polyangiaceae bacterium]
MSSIVIRGLKTGAALAGAITTTMAISSALKSKSPWAGLNAMATGFGVGGKKPSKEFDSTETVAGLGFLVGGMLVWGLGYEAALAAAGRRSSVVSGAMSTLVGYSLDRWVLSDHLVPNFKKTMGVSGTIAKYATLGIVSALASRISEGGQVGSVTAKSDQRDQSDQRSHGMAGDASMAVDMAAGAVVGSGLGADGGSMTTPDTEAGAAVPPGAGIA